MESIINAYERRLILTYMYHLVTYGEHNGLGHAADEEFLPDWIGDHADLLRCDHLPARACHTRSQLKKLLRRLREDAKDARKDTAARHLRRLGKMAELSRLDLGILEVLIRYKTQPVIESLIDHVDRRLRYYVFNLRNPMLGGLLGVSMTAILDRVRGGAPLIRSGLMSVDSDNDLVVVKRLTRLASAPEHAGGDVTRLLLGEPVRSELEWRDFAHLGTDRRHVRELLQGALQRGAAGVNVLLHGPAGSGKTEFAKALAARLGVNLFSIGEEDDDGDEPSRVERLQELKMAQMLARDGNSILLFDELEDLLASDAEWLWRLPLFSSPARGSEGSKVFLNRMLEQCQVPVIWTMNDARSVSPVILRRMMFALGLRLPPASVRTSIWERQFNRHGVTVPPGTAAVLAREYPVTPGVAEGAIRGAGYTNSGADAVRRAVNNIVRVLPGGQAPREAEPPERYDPSVIHADTDLVRLAEQLVTSDSRRFSLCLEGPPGSGKSAYVRYLAGRLDLRVLQKRASDLLSPYVGETEQQISAAFNEARAEQAFLVFDEADSLLADRRRAHRNWEVTQVNEMLAWMESHPLPFACTTNLGALLDPATLRRFLFKVTLRHLTSAQAEAAFQLYFDQPAPPEAAALANLTPADFAVVRKQAEFFGCLEEPARLAELLRAECQAKPGLNGPIGFDPQQRSCRQRPER